MSADRRQPRRRPATPTRSSSPTPWPIPSLMALKSSRSTNRTATCCSSRDSRASACSIAVVEERAVGQLGERIVEGAVAELLLERPALVDVARGQHDAVHALVAEQVDGDGLDVAVGPVGAADPPLLLVRRTARPTSRHAGEQGAQQRRVVRVRPLVQRPPDAPPGAPRRTRSRSRRSASGSRRRPPRSRSGRSSSARSTPGAPRSPRPCGEARARSRCGPPARARRRRAARRAAARRRRPTGLSADDGRQQRRPG